MKNVSELISSQAKLYPNKKAIVAFSNKKNNYISYTFSELEERINSLCHRFQALGVKPQDKVLVFVKPDLDFCAITFALFRFGAIAVFVDPGMPKKMFFKSLKKLAPDVLIGIKRVHLLSHIFREPFSNVRLFVNTTKTNGLRSKSLFKNLENISESFGAYAPKESDLAAILFTSGATGPAKGVEYTHDIFINQTKMLKAEFSLEKSDIDIAGFPLFSFFTLSMGMTSVVPRIDFSAPALCDPEQVIEDINKNDATFLAGSPSIWKRIADYCIAQNLELPSVKSLVMFGAPVESELHRKLKVILPNGNSYTPYGATECLPVSNISGAEVLSKYAELSSQGLGICVGKPLDGIKVKIIQNTESEIKNISSISELPEGEVGEILVHSKNVTKAYYKNISATAGAKIYDDVDVWHRMGDLGYLKDEKLWFCGRKKHMAKIGNNEIYSTQIEGFLADSLEDRKCALIGLGNGRKAAIVIEGKKSSQVESAVRSKLSKHLVFSQIKDIFFFDKFPVDTRHNIKINRTWLSSHFSEKG